MILWRQTNFSGIKFFVVVARMAAEWGGGRREGEGGKFARQTGKKRHFCPISRRGFTSRTPPKPGALLSSVPKITTRISELKSKGKGTSKKGRGDPNEKGEGTKKEKGHKKGTEDPPPPPPKKKKKVGRKDPKNGRIEAVL